jgi:3-deoxy-D-manno-octulosonic-acid transferase
MLARLYRLIACLASAIAPAFLAWRAWRGKEDWSRLHERYGQERLPRPHGRLIWLHGASVGEALSALPLLERLLAADPGLNILVTSGTVASARLLAQRLPADRALHRYAPLDLPQAVDRFLNHWHPDAALWMESELWPNLLAALRQRKIAAALINARMSAASARRWHHAPLLFAAMTEALSLILAQSKADAMRWQELAGQRRIDLLGNLKASAAPLPAAPESLDAWQRAIGQRFVWAFASAHPGEEVVACAAHRALRRQRPDALLLFAPRHPQRSPAMQRTFEKAALTCVRRSQCPVPHADDAVFIIDTMGELGLVYRTARLAVLGGSFVQRGGHNPLEPAMLGCPPLYGSDMRNFSDIAAAFDAYGDLSPRQADATALSDTLIHLACDEAALAAWSKAALALAMRQADAVERILAALIPLLTAAGALQTAMRESHHAH